MCLGRWDELISQICDPHFIFEYTLEFGVFEYNELLRTAARQLEGAPSSAGRLALSPKPLHVARCVQILHEHANFAAAHAEQLSSHPEQVFRLALAHGALEGWGGRGEGEAEGEE